MKSYKKALLLLTCCVLAAISLISCEWDTSPEFDHPLYVTYTVSASESTFEGPDQLLVDILAWIRDNHKVYDVQIDYSTGKASEFVKTDAEAVKKYEEFAPKFKAYLEQEVTAKLKRGDYKPEGSDEANVTVRATFHVYASRTQGEDGNLRYEEVKFSYP